MFLIFRRFDAIRTLGVALLALGLGACASVDTTGYRQAVLVRTEPAGAEIRVDHRAVGQTPAYVKIRRGHAPSVQVSANGVTKTVPLETRYRWHDSFFSNLIFFIYAPIGWLTDLATGTAWNAQDTDVIAIGACEPPARCRKPTPLPVHEKTYALAPPLAESLELSDAAGRALQKRLGEERGHFKLKAYDQTLPIFVAEGYDFDGATDPAERRNLYYALQTDGVYESRLETHEGHLTITARPYDTLAKEYGPKREFEFTTDDADDSLSLARHWLHFLPNTVELDSVSDSMNWVSTDSVSGTQTTISLAPPRREDAWYRILDAVSAINLTNLPARRVGRGARFQINLVPGLHISRRVLQAEGDPFLADQKFVRTWISGGYGAELGWQISRHYVYLNVIPQAYWDQISWSKNQSDFSRTGTGVTVQVELGYRYFFNAHWNVSLFTRSLTEDGDNWSRALNQASGFADYGSGSLNHVTVGVSLGYRFGSTVDSGHWSARKSPPPPKAANPAPT